MIPNTDSTILRLGTEIWHAMRGEVPGIFNQDFWQGKILEWAMRDPAFRVDLFRLVDVLPALKTRKQIWQHIKDYLIRPGRDLPGPVNFALKAASGSPGGVVAAELLKRNVSKMAENFIAGHTPREACEVLRRLHKEGIGFTADLLGEATLSEEEAIAYQERYLDLVEALAEETKRWRLDEILQQGARGPIPLANVSIKLSALDSRLDPLDTAGSVSRLKSKVLPILIRARAKGVFVNFDLEQWQLHGITYDLFEEILAHPELKGWLQLGIVVQAYLKSSRMDVERLLSLAKSSGTPITVRLVKGAYWDYETAAAAQSGCPCPVFTDKAETDANFESLSRLLLENTDWLTPAFGSHNLRSLVHAIAFAGEIGLPPGAYEIQMLYGMAEPERKVLRARGHRVRVYAPVGDLLVGMAYLVRRLLENTSNTGFLRLSYHEGEDMTSLLAPPGSLARPSTKANSISEPDGPDGNGVFENCPLSDFTDAAVRGAYAAAITEVQTHMPFPIPVVVDGEIERVDSKKELDGTFTRHSPSQSDLKVAEVSLAGISQVDRAVKSAFQAWPLWRDTPLEDRVLLLEKLAGELALDRVRLAALQVHEVGKPMREADADVAEAIDFCRYYARRARIELSGSSQGSLPGEDNRMEYQGRGPTAIIAPWNFPLAILCGMATAALAAGNPVLLKPSEQSSLIGFALFEHMRKAGFPPDVVHFLPGRGEVVGQYLVEHPLIAQIAFTGSLEVGLTILRQANTVQPGQLQLKRVVCEMGGKNAIIIDEDADLDEAVSGVAKSAFGYAGQKCSACSRVIVVGSAYEAFVERLVQACCSLDIAPATSPACRLGPVVDKESFLRLKAIRTNPAELAGARALYIGELPAEGLPDGHYLAPAIFEVESTEHRLMQEEFFGPVLALMKVADFPQALEVAVSTRFALTGGVYSRNPSHIAEARACFRVGNLYINRPSTGAMAHRQPFGGFAMSGLGTKAGGPGYLLNFAEPRVITENTMRHGFTPEAQ